MKKFISTILILILLLSTLGLFACGKTDGKVEDSNVVLINVEDLTEYDLLDAMSKKGQDLIKGKEDLTFRLVSVATSSVFNFSSSVVPLDQIYKEYYEVKVIDNETATVIYTGKFDFHDINNDGPIWAEFSSYMLGAIKSGLSKDKSAYEFVDETVSDSVEISSEMLVLMPYSHHYNLFSIMPFHSKEYYEEYAGLGILTFTFVRRARYSYKNYEFNPDEVSEHAGHYDGEYAEPGSVINFKRFGSPYNETSMGARLNVWETADYQMIDVINHFEKIGDKNNGKEWWYFLGTCHYGKTNPYEITYYVNTIDIEP